MDIGGTIGGIVSIIGAVFLLLAALGLVRMPDVYNRMQAGTKATTLGSILFLVGVGIAVPAWLPRLALLIVFVAFTNPISSHALIRGAHAAGVPMATQTVKDDLASDRSSVGPGRRTAAAGRSTAAAGRAGAVDRSSTSDSAEMKEGM